MNHDFKNSDQSYAAVSAEDLMATCPGLISKIIHDRIDFMREVAISQMTRTFWEDLWSSNVKDSIESYIASTWMEEEEKALTGLLKLAQSSTDGIVYVTLEDRLVLENVSGLMFED